ncbi:MAG: glycosyltransferase family 1 protein [Acidobacteriales bacterium]|nr:glycosyltransferase family 1 protein [Terriglobales bacterium]
MSTIQEPGSKLSPSALIANPSAGDSGGESFRILCSQRVALAPELAKVTDVLPETLENWVERCLKALGLKETARRSRDLRKSFSLLRYSKSYAAVVTVGDLEGLALGMWRTLLGKNGPVNVMYGCLWYGGNFLKRAWMRYCLRSVDSCIVWATVEISRYASTYKLPQSKFVYVPHHHTMKNYPVDIKDEGYVFAGGNRDRDFAMFVDAVRTLNIPCIIGTNWADNVKDIVMPANVQVMDVGPAEFRQLMAGARIVVMPMKSDYLHAGGQQSVLNAMYLGKPVVFTDDEGGTDYITDGESGVLVHYRDVLQLREAIWKLWEQPEMARAIGNRAREVALPLSTQNSNDLIWNHCIEKIRAANLTKRSS